MAPKVVRLPFSYFVGCIILCVSHNIRVTQRNNKPGVETMTTTQNIPASPTKLRDGNWGAKVRGHVAEGDIVRITTRAGKSWDAQVTMVVWTGDGWTICATKSIDWTTTPRSSRQSFSGRICENCDRPRRGLVECLDSSGISGRCCPACASDPVYTRSFA